MSKGLHKGEKIRASTDTIFNEWDEVLEKLQKLGVSLTSPDILNLSQKIEDLRKKKPGKKYNEVREETRTEIEKLKEKYEPGEKPKTPEEKIQEIIEQTDKVGAEIKNEGKEQEGKVEEKLEETNLGDKEKKEILNETKEVTKTVNSEAQEAAGEAQKKAEDIENIDGKYQQLTVFINNRKNVRLTEIDKSNEMLNFEDHKINFEAIAAGEYEWLLKDGEPYQKAKNEAIKLIEEINKEIEEAINKKNEKIQEAADKNNKAPKAEGGEQPETPAVEKVEDTKLIEKVPLEETLSQEEVDALLAGLSLEDFKKEKEKLKKEAEEVKNKIEGVIFIEEELKGLEKFWKENEDAQEVYKRFIKLNLKEEAEKFKKEYLEIYRQNLELNLKEAERIDAKKEEKDGGKKQEEEKHYEKLLNEFEEFLKKESNLESLKKQLAECEEKLNSLPDGGKISKVINIYTYEASFLRKKRRMLEDKIKQLKLRQEKTPPQQPAAEKTVEKPEGIDSKPLETMELYGGEEKYKKLLQDYIELAELEERGANQIYTDGRPINKENFEIWDKLRIEISEKTINAFYKLAGHKGSETLDDNRKEIIRELLNKKLNELIIDKNDSDFVLRDKLAVAIKHRNHYQCLYNEHRSDEYKNKTEEWENKANEFQEIISNKYPALKIDLSKLFIDEFRAKEKEEEEKEKEEEKKELTKEQQEEVAKGLEEFGFKKEEIEQAGGAQEMFKGLSYGQCLLVLENLKQITLGKIQGEAFEKFESQQKVTKKAEKKGFWQRTKNLIQNTPTIFYNARLNLFKGYKIMKLEHASEKDIKSGKYQKEIQVILSDLINKTRTGPEVEVIKEKKKTRLEVQYLSSLEGLNEEEKKLVENFNKAATKFSQMPASWGSETYKIAGKGENKEYEEAKREYEMAKSKVSDLLMNKNTKEAEKVEEKESEAKDRAIFGKSFLDIHEINTKVHLDQFLNTNPEVEKELLKIRKPNIWNYIKEIVKSEKGVSFFAGYFSRNIARIALIAQGSAMAMALMPVVAVAGAAGFGRWRGRVRGREELKKEELALMQGKMSLIEKERIKGERKKNLMELEELEKELKILDDNKEQKPPEKIARVAELKSYLHGMEFKKRDEKFKEWLELRAEEEKLKEKEKNNKLEKKDIKRLKEIRELGKSIMEMNEKGEKKRNFVDAIHLEKRLDELINDINKENIKSEERKKLINSLKIRINYINRKLEEGLVNFGGEKEILNNSYNLSLKLSESLHCIGEYGYDEKGRIESESKLQKKIDNILDLRRGHITEKQKKYIDKRGRYGAYGAAIFAEAGYGISHCFGNDINKFFGKGIKKVAKVFGYEERAAAPVQPGGPGKQPLSSEAQKGGPPPAEQPPGVPPTPEGPKVVSEDALKLGIVHQGKGIEHALMKQLEENPKGFGYNPEKHGSLHNWSSGEAHRLAIKGGYVKFETGGHQPDIPEQMRVGKADTVAYILNKDKSDRVVAIEEWVKNKDGKFELRETHPVADDFKSAKFEGADKEEYEYIKGKEVVEQGGAGKGKGGPPQEGGGKGGEALVDNLDPFKKEGVEIIKTRDGLKGAEMLFKNNYSLRMIAIDKDGNNIADSIRVLNSDDEIVREYAINTKNGEEVNNFIGRARETAKDLINQTEKGFQKITNNEPSIEQAQKGGIKLFAQDGLEGYEGNKLKFWMNHKNMLPIDKPEVAGKFFKLSEKIYLNFSTPEFQNVFKDLQKLSGLDAGQEVGYMKIFANPLNSPFQMRDGLRELLGQDVIDTTGLVEGRGRGALLIHGAYGYEGYNIILTEKNVWVVDEPKEYNGGLRLEGPRENISSKSPEALKGLIKDLKSGKRDLSKL